MRSLFNSLLSYFLTPGGLILMGALDASVVFFLPLGIDFVVIILTARKPDLFWLYPMLATVGLDHRHGRHVLAWPQGRRGRPQAADQAVHAPQG